MDSEALPRVLRKFHKRLFRKLQHLSLIRQPAITLKESSQRMEREEGDGLESTRDQRGPGRDSPPRATVPNHGPLGPLGQGDESTLHFQTQLIGWNCLGTAMGLALVSHFRYLHLDTLKRQALSSKGPLRLGHTWHRHPQHRRDGQQQSDGWSQQMVFEIWRASYCLGTSRATVRVR